MNGISSFIFFTSCMKKYVVEALGTFFFVLIIGLAVKFAGSMTAFVIGSALMVMVYAWGHISGWHYNPAVTLGLAVAGRQSWSQLIPYRASQLLGGIIGWYVAAWMMGGNLTTVVLDPDVLKVMMAELVFTFALVWVVLSVATSRDTQGNSFYGLAIGMTVFVGAMCVGSFSGWAFNPAVVIGWWFDGLFQTPSIWMHLVAELAWGLLAGLVYKWLRIE